jgi:hypothetical protein
MLACAEQLGVALGLLINLAASRPALRAAMAAQLVTVAPPAAAGRQAGAEATGSLLQLTCALLTSASAATADAGAAAVLATDAAVDGGLRSVAAGASLSVHSGSPGSDSVKDADRSMGSIDGSGTASIVEVYAALLLGFMVAGHPELQAEAAARLPGDGLAGMRASIRRCLAFYTSAGAITDASRATLQALARELEATATDTTGATAEKGE